MTTVMFTLNGIFMMEGLSPDDDKRTESAEKLADLISEIGFLPLFKNTLPGFSVEERTASDSWWSGIPERDPWVWREILAQTGLFAYGKQFSKKAGFVSRQWFPAFAALRREGLSFSERYLSGLASRGEKRIIDILTGFRELPAFELKAAAGYSRGDGEKGFESALTDLQMRAYLVVNGFQRKISRTGGEYGWPASVYTLPENLWGCSAVECELSPEEAEEKIISHLSSFFPSATASKLRKAIK